MVVAELPVGALFQTFLWWPCLVHVTLKPSTRTFM